MILSVSVMHLEKHKKKKRWTSIQSLPLSHFFPVQVWDSQSLDSVWGLSWGYSKFFSSLSQASEDFYEVCHSQNLLLQLRLLEGAAERRHTTILSLEAALFWFKLVSNPIISEEAFTSLSIQCKAAWITGLLFSSSICYHSTSGSSVWIYSSIWAPLSLCLLLFQGCLLHKTSI